jgi:hypothetical protein
MPADVLRLRVKVQLFSNTLTTDPRAGKHENNADLSSSFLSFFFFFFLFP